MSSRKRSPSGAFSDPEDAEGEPRVPVPPVAGKPDALSEGRVLFVRDPSILDEVRKRQKPGRCANCGRRLKGRQRVWCGPNCSQEAYEKSVLHDWDKTRADVLERDRYTCQECGRTPLSASRTWSAEGKASWAEVDHIVPVSEAPERQYDPSNLRVLCHECHAKRRRAAAKTETAAGTASSLNIAHGTKHAERVPDTGKTPKKVGDMVKADLLQNMRIEDVARKHGLNMNAVRGLWSSLLASGVIPKGTRPGEVPTPKQDIGPAAAPAPPLQVQVQAQPPAPAPVFQGQPGAGQGYAQPQPQGATPQVQGFVQQPVQDAAPFVPAVAQVPSYEIAPAAKAPNGQPPPGPAPLTLGGFPMTVDATGFVTKVYMNPKNLLWYDYFRKKHPEFDGDFADFISDTIEYFFKSQGLEVVIRKYERIGS